MHHRAYGMHGSPVCHVPAACIVNIGHDPPRAKVRRSTLTSGNSVGLTTDANVQKLPSKYYLFKMVCN